MRLLDSYRTNGYRWFLEWPIRLVTAPWGPGGGQLECGIWIRLDLDNMCQYCVCHIIPQVPRPDPGVKPRGQGSSTQEEDPHHGTY